MRERKSETNIKVLTHAHNCVMKVFGESIFFFFLTNYFSFIIIIIPFFALVVVYTYVFTRISGFYLQGCCNVCVSCLVYREEEEEEEEAV